VYSVIVFQIVYCNTTTLTLLPKLRRTAASLLHPELVWLFTSNNLRFGNVTRVDGRYYRILGSRIASSVICFPKIYLSIQIQLLELKKLYETAK
jgi:hypothetical protein